MIFSTVSYSRFFLKRIGSLCCIFLFYTASAQDLPCANEVFQQQQLNDPTFRVEYDKVQRAMMAAQRQSAVDDLYVIPIAVHVLHLGEPIGTGSNVSDQQIIDAVRGANERWRNLFGNSLDMKIEFCLAKFDPNGNPSTGIDRIDASSLANYRDYGISYVGALGEPGSDELATKNLLNWPHDYVFNIWVVHRIAGDWGGYAFFPFTFNYPTDGVVITDNSITYNSTTLAHELGHGMGLFHTFQGDDNGCPSNNTCFLEGDWVCDTPPHRKPDCSSSGYTCSNNPDSVLVRSFKNFMSYCPGRYLFTPGQKERSRLAIKSSTRWPLMKSYACSGPPCDTMFSQVSQQTCDPSVPAVRFDTLLTSKGCDSIVKILSPYIPPVTTQLSETTCDAASTGTHADTLNAASGCDSIVITSTSLIPAPHANFTFEYGSGNEVVFHNLSVNGTDFSWDFGDDSTSTDTALTHLYVSPGSYTVQLIAQNACSSDTSTDTVTLVPTSIRNQSNTKPVVIFPNPNHGKFSILMDVGDETTVNIVDVLGQTVGQQALSPGRQHFISFPTPLAKGIYQIIIKKNDEIMGISRVSVF
jgi:hypothetical protein